MVARWITGIVSGVFVWFVVYFLLALLLRSMFDGLKPWDTVVGFVVPAFIGLLAGIHSLKTSIRGKRGDPEQNA